RRAAVGGETIETLATDGPVAAIYSGDEVSLPASAPAPVSRLDVVAAAMRLVASEPVAVATGLDDAERVVSFGRGVRAKDDVAVVRGLAEALDAELACSMPIADDLGWLEKSRYVGRSGNHIKPALYLAVGIAGAPQHMEGVRGAKVVAAINSDPEARIFQTADYGIVGDLYEVIPALIAEVHK
ncbi:MAG TPA: electron transfer flavoprotein subunit alpha/FixB family protein, partial [Dermatophilaceae bacterium]